MKQFQAVLLALVVAAPLLAPAQNLGDGRAPLVTIRFNQANVYFEQQLKGAVTKAMKVKPDVVFDVVAFAPVTGNPQADQQWQATAGRNTRNVYAAMQGMGVPLERIHVIGKSAPGLKHDETRLYVR